MVRVMDKPPRGGTNRISAPEYLVIEKQSGIFEYLAAQQMGVYSRDYSTCDSMIYFARVRLSDPKVATGKPPAG
jgi:hypothetical protein